jgi:hypothetical protein
MSTEYEAAIDCGLARCDGCEKLGEQVELHGVKWRLCYGCHRCWTAAFIEHPTEQDALDFAAMIREASTLLLKQHVWDEQHSFWRPVEEGWDVGPRRGSLRLV